MSNTFQIDFFELMILAEACIPPAPIARGYFFDNLSDIHYHKMSEDERASLLSYIVHRNLKFDMSVEDCQHFYARYNPENQYIVKLSNNGNNEEAECYLYNGNYHTTRTRFAAPQYIKSIVRKHDNLKIK
jgi:hypothetical protein